MRYGYSFVGARNIFYDGVNLSEYFDITDVDIQPVPDLEVTATKIPGKVGAKFDSIEYGARSITLKMSLHGYDRNRLHISQVWRNFIPLLVKDEPKPMRLDEHRYINAIISNADSLERLGTRGVINITFTAPDPFFYGDERKNELVSGDNSIWIEGEWRVWPTITITGATDPLIVTRKESADKVYISKTVLEASKVVMDFERQRCTINGGYLAVDPRFTDFFELRPGNNTINLSGGSGVLTYKERSL